MAPLRRQDVALAARAHGLDADDFLARIESSQAGVLANRPVTLDFLLRLAKEGRRFPDSRVELYSQGCELLCAEDNQARRGTQRRGNRTPSERLTIAARIAAVLMLASREAVWIGPHADLDREQDCSVNDLVGPALMPNGALLEVTQNDLFETLDTGLFWLQGTDRLHFTHQSYGEFLAAWYLKNQRLPAARTLDLLSDPGTGGLVPQLHEVTTWAAAMDRDLFRSVLAVHPPVLFGSDVATAEPELRAALVDGILELANASEWADARRGLWAYYPKLTHPNLADQVRPWIEDKGRFIVARRIAIDIAGACGVTDLQDTLVALALDSAEKTSIRSRAVDVLGEVADQIHRGKLLPLLDLPSEEDPEDGIKGHAMHALWPGAIETLCRTVWLTSPQVQFARERLARRRERDARLAGPPLVPPPTERIAATLAQIEAGDADAFVQLTMDLALQTHGRPVHSRSADLRLLPGWEDADPATRFRIVAAAARYLICGNPETDRLLE